MSRVLHGLGGRTGPRREVSSQQTRPWAGRADAVLRALVPQDNVSELTVNIARWMGAVATPQEFGWAEVRLWWPSLGCGSATSDQEAPWAGPGQRADGGAEKPRALPVRCPHARHRPAVGPAPALAPGAVEGMAATQQPGQDCGSC